MSACNGNFVATSNTLVNARVWRFYTGLKFLIKNKTFVLFEKF